MESAETRKQGLLLWFSLIWSIVLLGFTVYVFESFLGGWLASQRQVLGKCLDGRPAGDAWSTAEFSIRPRALSFKEKWEPSTETPEINCHFPVFVYRCPSWASLDSFEECKEDSTDLPMLHRARQEKTGVFCWGKLGFYMWDTHRCASDVWNCTTGACSGYLKSERLCAAELRSEAYACWFDPVNPAVGVQTRRYEYCTWTGLLALVLAVLTTVAGASSTYFGSKLVRGLSERGFLERSRVREFICGPIPKYALLIICLIALMVFTEAVLFCLLLPGQTYYSIWGAAELPSSESLRVSDLHGLHSEAESPVSYGFNQPSFLARAARISVLVFQIYLMIALLFVSILAIIKYSSRSRTRPSNGDYLRLQLLTLLSEAAEEKCQARRDGADAVLLHSASQDLQWILALFSASLLDASEVGPDDAADLRSVEALLATSEAPKEAVETVPAAGDEVWACWPGDGRWFRAKVTRVSGRVEIAWLRRGSEGTGQEDEYLSSTGCDELQFTRLPPASVSAAKERPNPVVQEADRWQEQLSRVEECGARFRTMRAVCQKLSSRSSEALREDPLQGLADQLTALRKENEARISSLLNVAEERASVGGGINEQLACSTEGFQAEIDSMKQEQQVLQTRLDTLRKERQELAEKLQAMDEQILVVTAACKEAAQRENQVRASAQRVSVELQRELSMEEVEARKVGDRQRLLMEATAASRDIEGLLATRAEAATARRAAQEELRQQPPKAAKACLQSEKDRGRALEELMAGWHSAIWGPKAKELAADPGALSALRALHARAGGQLQQAWKETVQLAAECLGDTSALGDASEDISKAAERYKEMLKEVKGNVERMKVLEAERAKLAKETGGEKPQDAAQSEAAQDPKASPETLPEGKVASVLAETSHVPEPGTPAAEDDAE